MRAFSRQHRSLFALCRGSAILAAIAWLQACGIEVGNPSEPSTRPTKANAERTTVMTLAPQQYDEAILAAAEYYSGSTTAPLQLLLKPERVRGCIQGQDGSLELEFAEQGTKTRNTGQPTSRRSVTDTFERKFKAKMLAEGSTLKCKGPTLPDIDWSKLSKLNIQSEMERSRSRVRVSEASGQTIEETSTKSKGARSFTMNKIATNAGEVLVERTLAFNSELSIKGQTSEAASLDVFSKIETLEDEPLVIKETYDAEQKRTSLLLVSGAVVSEQQDGSRVVIRYENLEIKRGSSCLPSGGKVTGELFTPGSTRVASDTFDLSFASQGGIVRYSNGDESEWDFERCSLDDSDDDEQEEEDEEEDASSDDAVGKGKS